MKRNLLTLRTLFLSVLCVGIAFGAVAQKRKQAPVSRERVLETMKRATRFMMDTVSYRGAFVWNYLPDFSRSWGEMEAKPTMGWVQSPGTPGIGHLRLDAYHATGDEYYYEAAEKVAGALIWAQLPCGGWNYCFDFAGEASLKDWYNTIGKNGWRLEEFQHYYGNATFDDAATPEAANFILRMYVEKYDPKYKPTLDKAIGFVLESQYPIGGWPQRYPLRYEFSHHGNPDYSSYITLNDDVMEENTDFLIRCYQTLGTQSIMDPIIRSMNCMRILQQGKPQAGWALQYTLDLAPAGARTYEPGGLSSHGTASCIAKMMEYYRLTGDSKYLMGIPDALDFLESIKLPPSEVAKTGRTLGEGLIMCPTVVEWKTGKPQYVHRRGSNVVNGEYYVDQNLEHVIGHYGSVRVINIADLRRRFEEIRKIPVEELTKGSPLLEKGLVELPKYFTRGRGGAMTEQQVAEVLAALNSRGYWPTPLRSTSNPYIGTEGAEVVTPGDYCSTHVGDKFDTSPYSAKEPVEGISTQTYLQNMFGLIRYLDAERQ